jgi:3-hydroxyisobutyrate dehydrogenase-like beta-hydroxyacid dehydrogenase
MTTLGFVGLGVLAFSEGLLLAERDGVDPKAADEHGIPLPSAAAANEMLTTASELGYAHRDLAALHETLAHSPVA